MAKKNGKNTSLPATLIRQMGRKSDVVLGREFRIPASRVRRERRERGISPVKAVEWSDSRIALLGKMPDKEAAHRIGVTTNAVFSKRTALGIPPFAASIHTSKFQWKPSHLKKLGKISDAALAAELGISDSVVTAKRHSSGIDASQPASSPRNPWTRQELAMLGKKPDTYVAAKTGRGRRHVRARRESLGIPPFQMQRSIEWTAAVKKQLGVLSDVELAKQLSVSRGTVALYRRQQGIKPSRKRSSPK